MKAHEIKVTGTYRAKVSGRVVDVRVDRIEEKVTLSGQRRIQYHVTNLNTNRKLVFRSAAKFRFAVKPIDTFKS